MKKIYWISITLFLAALLFLFLPLTYYGFLDYIIENTVINMNIEKDTLETGKAAVAIYNGAGLNFIPEWALNLLTVMGGILLYLSIALPRYGKKILTKAYWSTFKLL